MRLNYDKNAFHEKFHTMKQLVSPDRSTASYFMQNSSLDGVVDDGPDC